MYKFYYQNRGEGEVAKLYRRYGWIFWLLLAIVYCLDDGAKKSSRVFMITIAVTHILINMPWKKYVKPFIQLDEEGIGTVMPYGQEFTKLEWKDVTKVFYTTDGGLSFYHGSDFTFFIPLRQLSEADKNSLIEIVKQKLHPNIVGLEKL